MSCNRLRRALKENVTKRQKKSRDTHEELVLGTPTDGRSSLVTNETFQQPTSSTDFVTLLTKDLRELMFY